MQNVLFVSIDALRYDHVSVDGESSGPTPVLSSLAEEGIWMDQHVSTGSGTSTSFPGIHASSLPLDSGYAGLNDAHVSLAEVLQSAGIQTLGVTANTSCSRMYDYDRGFDWFHDWSQRLGLTDDNSENTRSRSLVDRLKTVIKATPLEGVVYDMYQRYKAHRPGTCPYPQASEVTQTTLSMLDETVDTDSPFFAWIHYMEPHQPYYPPKQYIEKHHDSGYDIGHVKRVVSDANQARPDIVDGTMEQAVSERDIAAIRDFYAAATNYVDAEIGNLLDGLERRGLLDDTIVVVTADHGEELFDHGDLGHRPKLYDELIHVPMLWYDESGTLRNATEIETVSSHLDLAPTIADLFDVEAPAEWRGHSFEQSLLSDEPANYREVAIAELSHTQGLGGSVETDKLVAAVRSAEWKYICDRQRDREELYDLGADPGERKNIHDKEGVPSTEFSTLLQDRLEEVEDADRSKDLSREVKAQLERLGYVE